MRFKSSLIVFALSGACTQRVHSRVHTSRGDEVAMWGLKRVKRDCASVNRSYSHTATHHFNRTNRSSTVLPGQPPTATVDKRRSMSHNPSLTLPVLSGTPIDTRPIIQKVLKIIGRSMLCRRKRHSPCRLRFRHP